MVPRNPAKLSTLAVPPCCLHVQVQVKPRVFKPGRPIVVSGQEYMRKLGRHQRLLLPQRGSGQEAAAAGQHGNDWLC